MRAAWIVSLALPLVAQENVQSSAVINRIMKEMAGKGIANVPPEVRGGPVASTVCTAPMPELRVSREMDKAMVVAAPNAETDRAIIARPPVPACPQPVK